MAQTSAEIPAQKLRQNEPGKNSKTSQSRAEGEPKASQRLANAAATTGIVIGWHFPRGAETDGKMRINWRWTRNKPLESCCAVIWGIAETCWAAVDSVYVRPDEYKCLLPPPPWTLSILPYLCWDLFRETEKSMFIYKITCHVFISQKKINAPWWSLTYFFLLGRMIVYGILSL